MQSKTRGERGYGLLGNHGQRVARREARGWRSRVGRTGKKMAYMLLAWRDSEMSTALAI